MRFESPTTTKAAASLLAAEKGVAHVLAGGTDLLVRMKMGAIEPDLVVDVKRIDAMRELTVAANGVHIGGAVPAAALGESAKLRALWPGVVEAANLIGSDQIQGRCTVLGPGKTSLARGEFIEAIVLPARAARSGDAYLRFTPRTEMDIAVVSAAVNLTLSRGIVKTAKVVLGAVAPTAVAVPAAARALIGSKLDDAALEKMAKSCRAACNPIDDKRGTVEYRTKVAGVLARRAALLAYERAGGGK